MTHKLFVSFYCRPGASGECGNAVLYLESPISEMSDVTEIERAIQKIEALPHRPTIISFVYLPSDPPE